jgi:predicted metal-dependent peptidase
MLRRRRDRSYDLTDDEEKIWIASVSGAALASSLLRETMMLLRPYKSKIVDVAGIDDDWRVAIGPKFFTYRQAEREAIVIHLCLHAVCNYSNRSRNAGQNDSSMSRIAQDLEINQMVITLSRVRLPAGSVIPKISGAEHSDLRVIDVPVGKSMEQYYQILSHDYGGNADDSSQDASDSNQPTPMQASQSQSDRNDQPQSDREQSSSEPSSRSQKPSGQSEESDRNKKQDKRPGSAPPEDREDSNDRGNGAVDDSKSDDQNDSNEQSDSYGQANPNDQSNRSNQPKPGGDEDAGNRSEDGGRDESKDDDPGDTWSMTDDEDESSSDSDSSQSEKNHDVCANASESDISSEADQAGVPKSRNDQKVTATSKMIEQANHIAAITGRMPGLGSKDKQFAVDVSKAASPPDLDWRRKLLAVSQDLMSKQAYKKTDYSFKRVNRRGSAFMRDVAFPSIIGYNPKIMMGIDTSYSVSHDERQMASIVRNAQEIMKTVTRGGKGAFKAFCVDTHLKDTQIVDNVDDLNLTGGGGTDMSPAFEYISNMNRRDRPDVFILATDGELSESTWNKCAKAWPKNVKVIILITDSYYMDKIPKWLFDEASVIDISG